ncbi:Chloroperoxidase [Plasmopara halstedii]|uniref:Chloroperoxidase n=1 Tax=Plasmopara halstedii TaxID=4781 RepID=A0A0P1B4P9_PLAHL|nr:Chloroperoxidase [Plasmopara halstedii]CEG49773.1 Chloroperoxidase [Plasmopara halstedii]|eukprot:XP_024586142.1 Chloroperoxidase [Plasmopara halstedii]
MFRTTVAAAVALVALTSAPFVQSHDDTEQKTSCSDTSSNLKVGEYFKPSGDQVSGVFNNTAPFRRGPCPGFNVLANHGFISRNGQNISKASLAAVFSSVYNVAEEWTVAQIGRLPDVFSLDFLSRNDRDASFARDDRYFGRDPAEVNVTLAQKFLDRADADGKITLDAVAHARIDFANMCKAINPECNFNATIEATAFRQAALLLTVFGKTDFILAEHVKSFMVKETIPTDFVRSAVPVTTAALNATYSRLVEAAK